VKEEACYTCGGPSTARKTRAGNNGWYCVGCDRLVGDCQCAATSAGESIDSSSEGDPVELPIDKFRAALVDSAGLDTIPEPEPIVQGVLYRDSIAWLIGPPGSGKSFVALDIAGCVGTGEPWQTHQVAHGPVLFVVAEGLSGIRPHVRAWETASGIAMKDVSFLPVAVQAAEAASWQGLIGLAAELAPALIILDTQARVTVGLEENSAKDMGEFVHAVEKLRRASRACVLVVHHQGRNGDHMRGSTALEGAATTIVKVSKADDLLTVECSKQKDAAPFDEFALRMVPTDDSATLLITDASAAASTLSSTAAKMARTWWETHESSWCGSGQLIDVVAPRSSFYRTLPALKKLGLVEVDDSGRFSKYRLARAPEGV
jgi:hypothetical protein